MKHFIYLIITSFFSSVLFTGSAPTPMTVDLTESYSFENDLEGWTVNGTDVGDPPIPWSITRTQEMAKDGTTSLKFDMANYTDAAKIWIEKPFVVEPNQIYSVNVDYALASNEPSDSVITFRVITGVLNKDPETREDLLPAFKDSTAKDNTQSGYEWLNKKYEFAARSDEQGILYVVIGIWGTWEGRRIYHVDDVHITLTRKPEGTEFFSFEDGMEEWVPRTTDMEQGGGSNDWSITRLREFQLGGEDGAYSVKFDLNNLNGKGKFWIERPFAVEPKKKYTVNVEYAFRSRDCGDVQRFRLITGAFRKRPQTGDDLTDAYQEDTSSCNWGWAHKKYEFTVKSKKSRTLYVVLGVSGTEKAHRQYNFDSVTVTVTEK